MPEGDGESIPRETMERGEGGEEALSGEREKEDGGERTREGKEGEEKSRCSRRDERGQHRAARYGTKKTHEDREWYLERVLKAPCSCRRQGGTLIKI